MSLFCRAFLPDQTLKDSDFVGNLTRIAANLTRQKVSAKSEGPDLDIRFMLPFEADKPDFVGMRIHSWEEENTTLRIEAAVPNRILEADLSEQYIVAAIQDAIDNAAEFFEEIKVPFDVSAHHGQILAVSDKVLH